MTDVFISYKREHRNKARALAETLTKRGYEVWWDIELLPGQRFADEINAVLNSAKAAIVLWTPEAVASHWVKSEASIALSREILIPARLTEVEIPAPYNTLHTSDLTSWDGSADAPVLDELLAGVAKLVGKPVPPEVPLSKADIQVALARPQNEVEFWMTVSNKKPQSIAEYIAYIEMYGENASFATLARIRIAELTTNRSKRKHIGFTKALTLVGVLVGIIAGIIPVIDWVQAKLQPTPIPNIDGETQSPATRTHKPSYSPKIANQIDDVDATPTATPAATEGTQTSLREYPSVIFDINSKLAWAKNIYAVGYTKELFERSYRGGGSLAHDIKAIRDKASTLVLDGVGNWRLATTQDIATLRKIEPSAVFLAFYTYRPGPSDVIGIYQDESGNVSSWGYQHANHLSDPIESSWIQGNDLGVWLVSDASSTLNVSDGEPVYARPEIREEMRLEPIITGRLMKNGDQISVTWDDISDGLVGNLESDDTRSVFEYSLKPVDRGGFVRAELSLDWTQSSGNGEAIISIYQGDGLIKDGDWQPEGLISNNDNEIISWPAKQNSRIELPAHILSNFYNAEDIVGLHFRYAGEGNISFKPPTLIITYIKEIDLLTQHLPP